jgi:hypothetical protein
MTEKMDLERDFQRQHKERLQELLKRDPRLKDLLDRDISAIPPNEIMDELLKLSEASKDGERPVARSEVKVDAEPPATPEFLLEVFLRSKRGQALIGDMREKFACECVELGRTRAVRRYWAQTVRSLWPLLRRAVARTIKLGVLIDAFWHHWHG